MHADLRNERMLETFFPDRFRPLDLYTSTQQTRLPVNLVTRQRAVAATNAKIHVHHEEIDAIDNSGGDLFLGRGQGVWFGAGLQTRIVIGCRKIRE